jgi:hypothetical protein
VEHKWGELYAPLVFAVRNMDGAGRPKHVSVDGLHYASGWVVLVRSFPILSLDLRLRQTAALGVKVVYVPRPIHQERFTISTIAELHGEMQILGVGRHVQGDQILRRVVHIVAYSCCARLCCCLLLITNFTLVSVLRVNIVMQIVQRAPLFWLQQPLLQFQRNQSPHHQHEAQ